MNKNICEFKVVFMAAKFDRSTIYPNKFTIHLFRKEPIMLTTIFFYLNHLTLENKTFINTFTPLFHSLSKHNIKSCFLISQQYKSFPFPFVYIPEHKALQEENLSTFLSTHAPDQDAVIFVSDCAEFLISLKHLNYYTIGFAPSEDFLPVSYVFESFEDLDYTYFLHTWKRYQKEPITVLTTRHLVIRELSTSDFPNLYTLYEDKENIAYMDEKESDFTSFSNKMSAYIEKIYPFYGFGFWGVFLKETDELIGEFGIQPRILDEKEELELGYLLHRDYQQRGYAKEAIRAIFRYAKKQLDCDRIVAKIHKENKASIATAIACGMQFEKVLPSPDDNCLLYVIYVQTDCFSSGLKKQRETAAKQVYNIFQKQPDTRVYGKRYSHHDRNFSK